MGSLQYIGRSPDSDSSVTTKKYAVDFDATVAVTEDWVQAAISAKLPYLTTNTYVDQRDALRAKKSAVDAADNSYVPLTQVGQPNGVATLDSDGNVTSSQLPTGIQTNRVPLYYNAATQGTIDLGSGSTHTCTTTTTREYRIASITIPYPGFAWYPMCFGQVVGYAQGTDNGRFEGNTNYGALTVQPPAGTSDIVYAKGIGGSDIHPNFYQLFPYGGANTTPITQPHLHTSLQLDLYGSCWTGNQYVWSGSNLMFHVLVMPAI